MKGLTKELKQKSIKKWESICFTLSGGRRPRKKVWSECGFCIVTDGMCEYCSLFNSEVDLPICVGMSIESVVSSVSVFTDHYLKTEYPIEIKSCADAFAASLWVLYAIQETEIDKEA